MQDRYHVVYHGPRTTITETVDGEWPRWNAARLAAIEHVEDLLAEAQAALAVLRRAGNFTEYMLMGGTTP